MISYSLNNSRCSLKRATNLAMPKRIQNDANANAASTTPMALADMPAL